MCANVSILPQETEFRFAKEVCVSLIWLSCEGRCPFLHSCNTDTAASTAFQHENTSPLCLKAMTAHSATTEAGTVGVL